MAGHLDLDELDIRIQRELTQGTQVGLAWGEINPSYRLLGKRLGVSRETIRKRVEEMSRSGFLRVFPVQVNPALLGLRMGALSVETPGGGSRVELRDKLALIDGMLIIADHVGGLLGLIFYYEDERSLEKKIQLISRICSATRYKFTSIPYPRCSVALTPGDWKIVAALQRRRVRRPTEIARELGISTRTLKRRTKRMIDGMAISTILSNDARALKGAVIGNLHVEHSPEQDRGETDRGLVRELDGRLMYVGLWTEFSLFTVILPSIPAASELLEKVRRTRGVATARLDLIEERIEVYSTLRERVEKKLEDIARETEVEVNVAETRTLAAK
jgi:DNA-binding Lrp family transcriptional regulator